MYVKVIADSIAEHGQRLTSLELRYPRFIHAEVMTHRDRARNASSSRATPLSAGITAVKNDSVIPVYWGAEQRGMQTGKEIKGTNMATVIWLQARDDAAKHASALSALGVHRSLCNRLIEPFSNITVIMSATRWKNFLRLRTHPDAEIHIQRLAIEIGQKIEKSIPVKLNPGSYHLPYIEPDDWLGTVSEFQDWTGMDTVSQSEWRMLAKPDNRIQLLKRASTARCARVTYMTHGDHKKDLFKDFKLWRTLFTGSGFGHWSPMEHIATPSKIKGSRSGCFQGWDQFRKEFPGEDLEG